jgi:CubicO group peptidase (beta-lactamase class C family)
MGTATLGAVVERVDGRPLPHLLMEEFFQPLGMAASCLGLEPRLADRVARLDLSVAGTGSDVGGRDTDWGWNSDYWRGFGAPWGGMFSTPLDLCRFLEMFASGVRSSGHESGSAGSVLAPATLRAMTRNQTDLLPELPESERRRQAWGLGWRLSTGPNDFPFGDLLSPGAFGHAGATGTIVWHDPATALSAAIFSSRPLGQSAPLLHRCSTLIAAAAG